MPYAGLPLAARASSAIRRPRRADGLPAIEPHGDICTGLRSIARNPLMLRSLLSTGIDFSRALAVPGACGA
jgi:adenosylhomocysteine nucleosidase